MPLHPQIAQMIKETQNANNRSIREMSLKEIRESAKRLALLSGEAEPIHKIENVLIPVSEGQMRVRLYYPTAERNLPMMLYFHPGGFVKGSLETHDQVCRSMAKATKTLLISVDYSLAPEKQFPHQVEDAYAALCWAKEHAERIGGDPKRLIVGGESSGGNLAAVLTHLTKARSGPDIAFQVLIYPVTDYTHSFPSHKDFASGYLCEEEALKFYKEQYLPQDENLKDLKISPLWATDFSHLPPAILILAEYDPLRDEGEAYGIRLRKAGVPVYVQIYPGMVHGFLQMGGFLDEPHTAMRSIGIALQKRFN